MTGSGAGNGPYTSEEFDTTSTGAGEYHWIARFTGDANNNAAAGECLEEGENTEVEEASPEIATDATASVTVGAKIKDVATLSGLVNATGTGSVSFDLYKGEDCTEETFVTTLKATPSSVTGSGAGNGPYTSEEFDTTQPAPANTTGSPASPATPTTTPPQANAWKKARTAKSKRRAPKSPPTRPPRSPSAPKSKTSPPSRAWSARPEPARSASTSTRAKTAPKKPSS